MAKAKLIKIRVSREMINTFFLDGEHHFNISNGITTQHQLLGVIQESQDGCYYFIFKKGKVPEGRYAELRQPIYRRLE